MTRVLPNSAKGCYKSALPAKRAPGTEFDTHVVPMGVHWAGKGGEREPGPDEAPETPLDEPRPPQVQDSPPQPSRKGRYVVHAGGRVANSERKERRGFASMSPEKQREIASKGGRAAHEKGTAHEWTADEARSAGRRGGQVSRGGRGGLIPWSGVSRWSHQNPDATAYGNG